MAARVALLFSAILISSAALFPQSTAAQAPAVLQAVASSDGLAQAQAALAARTAELRRAWIASGHNPGTLAAPPAITSGKILTPEVNVTTAPAAPAVSVKFTTGPAGLSYISLTYSSNTSSQYTLATYLTAYKAPPLTQGFLKIQRVGGGNTQGAFNLYSAAGAWTLSELSIADKAGNSTNYNQTQLAAIFPSLTVNVVNNRSPDTTPPLISSAKVLTPVVSLSSASPDFGASLTVSDDLSGVQYGLITVTPPGSNNSFVANQGDAAPVVNGTVKVYVYLGGSTTTGTWTISQFGACDVTGNCTYDSNPSDIQALFGTTTFKVKN